MFLRVRVPNPYTSDASELVTPCYPLSSSCRHLRLLCQTSDQPWKVLSSCGVSAGLRAAPSCVCRNKLPHPPSLGTLKLFNATSALHIYFVGLEKQFHTRYLLARTLKCENFPECIISHPLCIVSYTLKLFFFYYYCYYRFASS